LNILPRFIIEDDAPELLWRFTAYIKKVVGYARLEYLRSLEYRYHEDPIDDSDPDAFAVEDPLPPGGDEFELEEERLSQAFSTLSLLRRRILTLVFVEGLSAQETAEKLSCSVDYVYKQKNRALKALRDQLMDGG
jgi:RNA polymerase sigma factor (sigma-70 family)